MPETTRGYSSPGPVEWLARSAMNEHPRPWRIERDWGWEVWAADGFRVAMVPSRDEAEAIVASAVAYDEWLNDDWTEGACQPTQTGGCTGAPHRPGCPSHSARSSEVPDGG